MSQGNQEGLKIKYSAIPTPQFAAIISYAIRAVAFWEKHQKEIIRQPAYQREMGRYFQNLVNRLNDVEEVKIVELEM